MNYRFLNITPKEKGSFEFELNDCLKQLSNFLDDNNQGKNQLLKQAWFLNVNDYASYVQAKDTLDSILNSYFGEDKPPLSFISQPPGNDFNVSAEFFISDKTSLITRKKFKGFDYLVLDHITYKEIIASGLTDYSGDIKTQSESAFKALEEILKAEEMEFSNIVRQWNYIENIISIDDREGVISQNYQIFNDVRAKYYNQSQWPAGYPSATGIGMKCGGVIIDFIAVKGKNDTIKALPLNNPRQTDAHKYTKEVLVGETINETGEKCPPKFERGKLVHGNSNSYIFVSGTAAIIGQESIKDKNVAKQTVTTIDNMKAVASIENIRQARPAMDISSVKFEYIRAYVKHYEDIEEVRKTCEELLPGVPASFVQADICRDGLLVEIEGFVGVE